MNQLLKSAFAFALPNKFAKLIDWAKQNGNERHYLLEMSGHKQEKITK
jgi:hypothetical protein